MKFVDVRTDIAFKKVFGDENKKPILISFLNAILDLKDDKEIQDLSILNPYQAPKLEGLKETILDIRAVDRRGVIFIVEMQIEKQAAFAKRVLYYTSKAYVSQIGEGIDYPRLNQVIFIGILDFAVFEGNNYLTRHLILNTNTLKQEIKDFEFTFIELPKFVKEEGELKTMVEKWVYFIKHSRGLQMVPKHAEEKELIQAYEVASKFNWSKEELEIYDYWSIREQDARGALELAREEAMAKGLAEGRAEGKAEGGAEGKAEGKAEGRAEGKAEGEKIGRQKQLTIAINRMVAKGMGVAEIADFLGISEAEVRRMMEQDRS